MEKILVTTDLSPNSIAGLRFAIQLAAQRELELIFFHANDLWDETEYREPGHMTMLMKDKETILNRLESMVDAAYKSMRIQPGHHRFAVYYHMGVINSILHYAQQNDCDYICISTHGAGNVLQLLGSITSELISESEVPVLCIPRDYEARPIDSLMYASDMTDHETELDKVVAFAKAIRASVQVFNVVKPGVSVPDDTSYQLTQKYSHNISLIVEHNETKKALADKIDEAIQKYAPSMLVMFTNQDRNLLALLFNPSQTGKYSFRTRIPLLAYPKTKDESR